MSNYTNKNNVEKYLGEDFPASLDAFISSYLSAIDNWIDNYIGRTFKDNAADTKYYDLCGGKEIYIDNFEDDPTEVSILTSDGDADETLTIDEDYRTYPWNETVKFRLVLIPNGTVGSFPTGDKRLKVTASFGVTDIPADITLVATMLLASIMSTYTKGGETIKEEVGDVKMTYKELDEMAAPMRIYNILDQYRFPVI